MLKDGYLDGIKIASYVYTGYIPLLEKNIEIIIFKNS